MIKFLNCKIDLSKKVFEPRIETEFWVGKAIGDSRKSKIDSRKLKILDIFAGTGCIGIAVLRTCPELCRRVDFADISKEAVEQIKINLKLNKISPKRYEIYKSNIFEKLKGRKYNIIFANPPYVALDRISEVQREVLEKDPKKSLFGGRDGMFWIEKFLKKVKNYLKKGGIFYMEFDPLQKEKIKKILEKENFKFNFYKDQFQKFRWLKATY
jgi:HemK-like putative methylase